MPRTSLSGPNAPSRRRCPSPIGHFQIVLWHYRGNWIASACQAPFTLKGCLDVWHNVQPCPKFSKVAPTRERQGRDGAALTWTMLAVMSSGLALQCSRSRPTPSIRDWYSLASSSRVSSRSCSTISKPSRMEERSPASRGPLELSLRGRSV